MATYPQTFLPGNRPRIVHGDSISEVFAYPSTGGFVRKTITAAELEWLDLRPRLSAKASNDSVPIAAEKMNASDDEEIEDAFALRFMQLGGRWWPNEKLRRRHPESGIPYGQHYPPHLDVGYSFEGVFVLRWAVQESYTDLNLYGFGPEKPETWSRLALCTTMEERCAVLRDFGAVVYNSFEECPDLPDYLEDGIAQGEYYAMLLRKMENSHYLDQWMCSLSDIIICMEDHGSIDTTLSGS